MPTLKPTQLEPAGQASFSPHDAPRRERSTVLQVPSATEHGLGEQRWYHAQAVRSCASHEGAFEAKP